MATKNSTATPTGGRLVLDWLRQQSHLQWVREPVGDGRQSIEITRLTSRISMPTDGQVRLARVRARDGQLAGVRIAVRAPGAPAFQDVPLTNSDDADLALATFDGIELSLAVTSGGVGAGGSVDWRHDREERWAASMGIGS